MAVAFTDRELDVMEILWADGPATVAEVRHRLSDDLAYTTVLTVLRTLEEKGHVGHRDEGKAHRYFPKVAQIAARRSALTRLVDRVFEGSAELLLTQLVADRDLSRKELERLRRVMDERLSRGEAMIAVWMIYAVAVTAVLGLVGISLERIANAWHLPRRIGWAAMTVTALVLSAAVARRREPAATLSLAVDAGRRGAVTGIPEGASAAPGASPEAQPVLADRIRAVPAQLASRLEGWDTSLLALWSAGAAGLSCVYLLAAWALSRRRRRWLSHYVDGVPVLLAADDGPAVVGVMHPRIVLPRWILALDPASRALLLQHECEHVLSRDPLLMHAATLAVVLMPWNPGIWWIHRRLRLAIELDCDARVLATEPGRPVRDAGQVARYGELLLAVARHRSRHLFQVVPAFLEHNSSLSRRISAMCADPLRRPRLQAALAGSAAALLFLVAAKLPVPRLNAQEPGGPTVSRIIGSPTSSPAPVMSRAATHELLQRYFPDVLRGEGPESVVFLRDAGGRIVGTMPMQAAERIIGFVQMQSNDEPRARTMRERTGTEEPDAGQAAERRAGVVRLDEQGRVRVIQEPSGTDVHLGEEPGIEERRAREQVTERQARERQQAELQSEPQFARDERELRRTIQNQVEFRLRERGVGDSRREESLRAGGDSNRDIYTYTARLNDEPPLSSAEMTGEQRGMAERLISADVVRHGAGEVGPRPVRVLFLTIRGGTTRP